MKFIRILSVLIMFILLYSCATPAGISTASERDGDTQSAASGHDQTAAEAEIPSSDGSEPEPASAAGSQPDKAPETDEAEEVGRGGPPLGDEDFTAAVDALMPWNMSIMTDDGRPMIIRHDLDKNGYEDALVVAVEGAEIRPDIEEYSKSARLFLSGQEYSNFLLLIFYQNGGELMLRYTVPVSRQLVFKGVEPFEIRPGSDFPYALLFSFRTRAGIEEELVILSGYGITHFTIKENLSEITIIEDIDEDGYKDIVVHEQGFEEGTGFETFLTWYKWNLREYTEYKSTNIVRNLREFFLVCAEYLRAGEIADFLEFAFDPEAYSDLKKQGLNDAEILNMIFSPAGGFKNDAAWFGAGGFSAVVFPELMETPFSYAKRNDFRHQVSVRMGRHGEQSRIFLAELMMKKNPFQEKQFCFIIE